MILGCHWWSEFWSREILGPPLDHRGQNSFREPGEGRLCGLGTSTGYRTTLLGPCLRLLSYVAHSRSSGELYACPIPWINEESTRPHVKPISVEE